MTLALPYALVRIWDRKKQIAGAGYLVSTAHILICAYVVCGVPR